MHSGNLKDFKKSGCGVINKNYTAYEARLKQIHQAKKVETLQHEVDELKKLVIEMGKKLDGGN